MKYFDIDWQAFIKRLDAWESVSLASRQLLCTRKASETIPVDQLKDDLELLTQKAFVGNPSGKGRVATHPEAREFMKAVRFMYRHPLQASSSARAVENYLGDNFTADERQGLVPNERIYGGNNSVVTNRVSEVQWVVEFLDSKDVGKWANAHRNIYKEKDDYPTDPRVLKATQKLVRALIEVGGWSPVSEVSEHLPKMSKSILAQAIGFAIRFALVFPTMEHKTLVPSIGVLPAIAERMNRPVTAFPESVSCQDTFCSAIMIDDLTTLLVAAAGEPLRLKANSSLYAKVRQDLDERLVGLPQWMARATCFQGYAEARPDIAKELLYELQLVQVAGERGRSLSLVPTKAAESWLNLSPKQQLHKLLAYLNGEWSPHADDNDDRYYPNRVFELVPYMSYELSGVRTELTGWVLAAWGELPSDGFVTADAFLKWHAETKNPLLDEEVRQKIRKYSWHTPSEEVLEDQWSRVLLFFMVQRLIPLGGLRVGYDSQGSVAVSLTDIGRFMLGVADDFEYGQATVSSGAVVIQPNFEVTFLAPSPAAEVQISRIAERKRGAKNQRGVGTLFRITRDSILAAAATGLSAKQALATLGELNHQSVPKNVEHEIESWFALCRRVTLKPALLVHCPDHETATTVLAAAGKSGKLLTATVIEIDGDISSKTGKALPKKLRKMGIFVNEPL
jgi:hypothetical protein